MRLVFHEDGILSQFEGYEQLEEFDWEGYRSRYGDISRLDRILESEGDTPNRYKVSKQADVLMLFYLLSSDELGEIFARLGYDYDEGTIPQAVDYYLERTAHGSTLSRVVHAWVLARSDRRVRGSCSSRRSRATSATPRAARRPRESIWARWWARSTCCSVATPGSRFARTSSGSTPSCRRS